MLIQRLLAAIILIPLVIVCLFFLPLPAFIVVMLAIFALSAWEWAQFLHFEDKKKKGCFTLLFTLLATAIYYLPIIATIEVMIFKSILICSVMWWLIAILLVSCYSDSTQFWQHSLTIQLLFAFFTLVPFFIGMIQLRTINYHSDVYQGAFWLLYVLVLVWVTDSGAYFAGRLWGKHKLAPFVSPGKTVEGLIGGLLTSLSVCLLVYFNHFFNISFYPLIISSVLAILASVLGDLTESMFKRVAKIKDSGHLIPGHGGVLDRIDSLTAAIPIFTVFLLYFL